VLLVETVTDIAWLHRAEHTAAIPVPRIRRLQQLQRALIEIWVLLRQRYWIEEVRRPAGNEQLRVRVQHPLSAALTHCCGRLIADQEIAAGENLKKRVLRRRLPSLGFHGSVPCVVASVKMTAEPALITPPKWLATLIPTELGLDASVLRHSWGSGRLLLCLHTAAALPPLSRRQDKRMAR
jgi:hypothetical protein